MIIVFNEAGADLFQVKLLYILDEGIYRASVIYESIYMSFVVQ